VNQARIPVPRCAFILLGIFEIARKQSVTRNLKKAPRVARNPKTGTEVRIAPRRVIVFKPSAVLKARINRPRPDEVA
jgi:nucleoid DNA-binding protein